MFSELLSQSRQLAEHGDLAQARAVAQRALDCAVTDAEVREADVWITDLNGHNENADTDVLSYLDELDDPCRAEPQPVVDATVPSVEVSPASTAIEALSAAPQECAPPDPKPAQVSEQEKKPERKSATKSPEVCAPTNARGADPGFEDYQRRQQVTGSNAKEREARQTVLTEVIEPQDKTKDGVTPSVQAAAKVDPSRKRKGLKISIRNQLFGAPALLAVAGVVATVMVLQPWNISSTTSDVEMPATSRSGFPELELRQPRRELVSTEEIGSKLSAPEKKQHQEVLPSEVSSKEPEVVTAVAANRETEDARPKTESKKRPVTKPHRDSGWTTNASGPMSPPTREGAAQPRRPGSRFFSLAKSPSMVAFPKATGALSTGQAGSSSKLPSVGLAINSRLRATLQLGIASTRHGKVIAEIAEPVRLGDRVVVPQGALITGVSSSDSERVYIRFTEVIVDGQKFGIEGTAVSDDLPGIPAERRQATLEERQSSEIARGALDVAKDLAVGFAGPAGNALRRVGEGAVHETQREKEYDSSVVLMVPAKTKFFVVVTE